MINKNIQGMTRMGAILLFLTLAVSIAKAQGRADNSAASSKLSADLSISLQKALELNAALSNPEQQIKDIQDDKQLLPKQKQKLMVALLTKRRRALDSLLTPEQKAAFLKQAAAARQASYRQTGTDTSRINH
ncbi:hypothetical protein [Mucilaginibacter sp. HD30]